VEEDVKGLSGQLVVSATLGQVAVHLIQQVQLQIGDSIMFQVHFVVLVDFF
jgi:hypothetical protein